MEFGKKITRMKNRDKILIGATTTLTVVSLVLLLVGKKLVYKRNERLDRIAEEGYEFAADVLYPVQNKLRKKFKSEYSEIRGSYY